MRPPLMVLLVAQLAVHAQSGRGPTPPGYPPSLKAGCLKPDDQIDLFCPGDEQYGCYKIPTLLRHTNGTLVAIIEARKFSCDDHGYVDLRLRRSHDDGFTWEKSRLVHGYSTPSQWTTVGDANVVEDTTTGTIWMFHTRNNSGLFLSHSTDVGSSWTEPVDANALKHGDGAGSGHAGGIQLSHGPHKGRLLVPLYSGGCYLAYSDDHGATWHKGSTIPDNDKGVQGAGEWAVAETGAYTADGTPILLGSRRNTPPHDIPSGITGKGYRLQSLSHDGGLTWGPEWEQQQLPEPIRGCEGALVFHPGSKKLYFSHPDPDLDLLRNRLRLWASADMGATWEPHAVVWPEAAGYSSLVVMGNATDAPLGVFYDRNNRSMLIFEAQSVSFVTAAP